MSENLIQSTKLSIAGLLNTVPGFKLIFEDSRRLEKGPSKSEDLSTLKDCGQATVNKKTPIHYIISINDKVIYKNVKKKKNPLPQFHGKTVQSNILWLNLNKINELSILQSVHKQGNPSFHFHAPGSKRRYQCTQTASAVSKYFPCLLQFYTGYRI